MIYEPQKGTMLFWKGMLAGSILGAVCALLRAPQSGTRTREQIAAKAEETVAMGRRGIGKVRLQADDILARAQQRAEQVAESALENINDLADLTVRD